MALEGARLTLFQLFLLACVLRWLVEELPERRPRLVELKSEIVPCSVSLDRESSQDGPQSAEMQSTQLARHSET